MLDDMLVSLSKVYFNSIVLVFISLLLTYTFAYSACFFFYLNYSIILDSWKSTIHGILLHLPHPYKSKFERIVPGETPFFSVGSVSMGITSCCDGTGCGCSCSGCCTTGAGLFSIVRVSHFSCGISLFTSNAEGLWSTPAA